MDPFRPLVVDNRMPQGVFIDGNPLSDGMANFAASLINAPQAAAQVRDQRNREALAQAFQQKGLDRQAQQDQLSQLWHDQGQARDEQRWNAGQTRQASQDALALRQFESLDADRKADNARQTRGQVGEGALNMAKLLGGFFTNKQSTQRNSATGWHSGTSEDGSAIFFRTSADGQLEIYDPKTKEITKTGSVGPIENGASPTPVDTTTKNTQETGYPDRESNWYNPADWFRSAPAQAPATLTPETLDASSGDHFAGEERSTKLDMWLMNEIASDPVRSARWKRLPQQKAAQYQAIFTLPETPANQRAKMRAMTLFAKEL